ncbi:hypothetical protein KKB01_01840 [bacterium]|nr:hypothetical protein [bacterium]PKP56111.1 MAG: hypothetical protein CVT91_13915 [Candidatus Atribacteria bacterium HGW-Atribacteria-1]
MLTIGISNGLKALWILGENDNNKKLQFEVSPIVMYKRNTSQNMSIWEHKRSNAVILSAILAANFSERGD